MSDDFIKILNLGAFTDKEKKLINSDFSYKKKMSRIMKEARKAAKRDTCYFCDKPVTSFCNSHSVPRFCLRNIAIDGEVLTLNTLVDNPFLDSEKGVENAGVFHLICNDCDSKIFSDYENPDNYNNKPTPTMINQIALKNSLKSISKRNLEIEQFNILEKNSPKAKIISQAKNVANKMDLNEYKNSYIKAKRALEKNSETDYYVCYYEKLNYVVPIAFQASVALVVDFEGNVINNIYNPNPEYKIQNIHISIFPLKQESVIIMFIENGDKRYRPFYKQFNKLEFEDKLAALTLIMFMYSEDMYFSKSIKDVICNNKTLQDVGKTGQDLIASTPFFNPIEILKKTHDLDKRYDIPNILSEKYKVL
ncbi:MAG: hypothetical protein IJB74_05345 [Clostridia bacterium]|nr:hypothetical protein [Clostridia bacterium]